MGRYDLLRSTRHRRVDGLIIDMLQKDLWQDAVSLVGLFNKVHPHSETAQEASSQQASGLDLLKIYAKRESQRTGYVELALQAYEQTSAEIRLTVMHHHTLPLESSVTSQHSSI
ncbi:28S ribosomal protein S22, mitochondrial-like [Oncorhynchus keta]|uniref:28S ribosomal protein S22, mitochondrial-like n=1 Tax=Oncorhynchus keta TaxID=8018 RepID=UPI0015FB3E9D|nr:28S ribosomal protein S22, mitochondrial-like [Oncorhynchus keta]